MLNFRLKIGKLILLIIVAGFSSCATTQQLSRGELKDLNESIKESPVFSKIFTGFALFDPKTGEMLYEQEADKYYTPASNTKLYTFYTSLKILKDSMPVLRYHNRPGATIIQGTGNPMFLHPDFPRDTSLIEKIRSFGNIVYFSADNYKGNRFGPGWSWGDYSYYYQTEISPFPIYGNFVRIELDSTDGKFLVTPERFSGMLRYDVTLNEYSRPVFSRGEFNNQFTYNEAARSGTYFSQDIPIYDVNEAFTGLLGQEYGERILRHYVSPTDTTINWETIWQPLPDTLLKKFMWESDNSIAEQLLLLCSAKLFDGELNTSKVIQFAKDSLLSDLPDEPRWVDGSGLSRYNLFTPRTTVAILHKMYQEYPQEWLFSMLPAGGERGTIRNWYGGKEEPYVFAKTGTLSNKHCLSGYIKTKSGDVLIFSFMNNNYVGSSSPVKEEMQKVLEWIWENY